MIVGQTTSEFGLGSKEEKILSIKVNDQLQVITSYEQILIKCSGNVDNDPRSRCLHFGDVLDSGGTLTFELPKIRVLMGERAAGGGPSSPRGLAQTASRVKSSEQFFS